MRTSTLLFIIVAASTLACGGDGGATEPGDGLDTAGVTLRSLADPMDFIVGAFDEGFASNFDPPRFPLQTNDQYRTLFLTEFNAITVNVGMVAMRASATESNEDAFVYLDSIVDFAAANEMKIFFHHLVWHESNPSWLAQQPCDAESMGQLLQGHIQDVVSRYRGRIYAYSVVNEPFDERFNSAIWNDPWMECMGEGYIAQAFRWAREADPTALLYLNEFNAESTIGESGHVRKSDALYDLVGRLVADSVPIDGVGFQMHTDLGGRIFRSPPDRSGVSRNMDRLAALGLDVWITEMDVAIFNGTGSPTDKLSQQATVYGDAMDLCLTHAACRGLTVWGLTDAYSWVYELARQVHQYEATPPDEAPLLFDTAFRPKPAYVSVRAALAR